MITKNYEYLLASALVASNSENFGFFPVISVDGITRFLCGVFDSNDFPAKVTRTLTLDQYAGGISIGTGDTPPTKNDINLEATITSGVTLTLTETVVSQDRRCPYIEFTITVTNTGAESLTIKEIGYKQKFNAAPYPGGTSASSTSKVMLLDRSLLAMPLTIESGDAGVLKYRLDVMTDISVPSFTWSSDNDVANAIDAAQAGEIDLQADYGWRVGDVRTIHMDAWTGYGGITYAEQDIDIVISEFGDYNNSGSILQFDFVECPLGSGSQKMASSATNVGGYAATEAYTETLPAMVAALPEWLRTRLVTFAVKTSKGNQSDEIEDVPNNKLALRSVFELLGKTSGTGGTFEGEGHHVEFYKRGLSANLYNKTSTANRVMASTANNVAHWTRSPATAAGKFAYIATGVSFSLEPYAQSPNTSSGTYYLCPFGCL